LEDNIKRAAKALFILEVVGKVFYMIFMEWYTCEYRLTKVNNKFIHMKRFSRNYSSGFTLIELLVVIAIIGILSSVVLASLNTARSKGADAAVKSNLNNVRPQAELFYDAAGDYTGVCATGGVNTIGVGVQAALTAGSDTGALAARCFDDATTWVAWATLKSDPLLMWCADSTGVSRQGTVAAAPAAAGTPCP
jgi:prepilin-type N-terminal cleavage/methylation domain-containing protein